MKRLIIIIGVIAIFSGLLHFADWAFGQPVVPGGTWYFQFMHDTPNSYTGQAGKYVRVNLAGDALDFVTLAGGGDMAKATYDTDADNKIDQAAGGTELDTSGVTDGQVLIGTTAGNVWALGTLTGTANEIDIANAGGSITIGLIDPLAVAKGGTGAASLNDLITLGTHTTGNYAATVADAGSSTITVANSGSESAAITLDVTDRGLYEHHLNLTNSPTDNYILSYNLAASNFTWIAAGGFDSTTVDDTTWSDGSNATNTWTFDVSGTDHTMAAGSGLMTFSHSVTVTGLLTGSKAILSDVADDNLTLINPSDNSAIRKATITYEFSDGDGACVKSSRPNGGANTDATVTLHSGGDLANYGLRVQADKDVDVAGDLTIAGDDLFMGTNTDKFILVADGTNFNPVESTGDVIIDNTGAATIQANSVALGTDTTGNYIATIADNGSGTTVVVGSGSETASVTVAVAPDSLDFTEFADAMTLDASTQISLGANDFIFQVANPGSNAIEINGTGAFSADLLHVHQHTGNPSGGSLIHAESVDTDISPMVIIHQDKADIDAAVVGLLIDAVDDDDSSWTPFEVRDDSDNNDDLLFQMDYTGTVQTGIWDAGAVTSSGAITATGSFIIGAADMSEADLEKLDGITNGTAAANKALVLGASGEIGTITTATMTNASITTATMTTASVTTATITNNIKVMPQHLIFNTANPLAMQTEDNEWCLWPVTPAALTVTKIVVTLNSAANEVAGDLKYADAFISLANPVVINTFDTSSGVLSDDSISSGSVAAGKAIYIAFDSAPNTAITQMCVDITFDYD